MNIIKSNIKFYINGIARVSIPKEYSKREYISQEELGNLQIEMYGKLTERYNVNI